jgi:hypothetical protein
MLNISGAQIAITVSISHDTRHSCHCSASFVRHDKKKQGCFTAEEKKERHIFCQLHLKNIKHLFKQKTNVYMYPKGMRGTPLGATPSRTIEAPPRASTSTWLTKSFGKRAEYCFTWNTP